MKVLIVLSEATLNRHSNILKILALGLKKKQDFFYLNLTAI